MPATMTLTKPTPAPSAPVPTPAAGQPLVDPDYIAAVSLGGALRLPTAPSDTTATTVARRTRTGTTYRIDLGDGIVCWLDGDQTDGSGELNWVATQMCTLLSGGTFTGPDDAPFVCGLVLFTGTAANGPVALSERQLRRVVNAHAAASADEGGDTSHADAQADSSRSPRTPA